MGIQTINEKEEHYIVFTDKPNSLANLINTTVETSCKQPAKCEDLLVTMGGGQSRESNYIVIIYTITDEIPGFFLLLKKHIFIACSEDTIFIFHV